MWPKPRNAGSHQKLKRQGTDTLLELLEGVWLCYYFDFGSVILILDFAARPRGISFYCFKPLSL